MCLFLSFLLIVVLYERVSLHSILHMLLVMAIRQFDYFSIYVGHNKVKTG